MDVENSAIESSSFNLKKTFSHIFDWSNMCVTYGEVDVVNKRILTMPSNYEWYLMYWNYDMDLKISERIVPGIQYWNDYSPKHAEILLKNNREGVSVDICTQCGNVYELLSINSKVNLTYTDMMAVFKWKPIIAFYAQRIWHQNRDVILPLREEIPIHEDVSNKGYKSLWGALCSNPYMRFGNIQFTRKEIITIRLLLSNQKIEDIAAIQRCSVKSEYVRIQKIREKLNCESHSSEGLFNALQEHGITLSCLNKLTVYP